MTASQLSIPSGSVTLEAIYWSPRQQRSNALAVIAHPYGSLGGSMEDRVVQEIKDTFNALSIPAVTYNSRGVGQSTGKGSWTGEPEREDYQNVVRYHLEQSAKEEGDGSDQDPLTVYCCGYSYGSLMASTANDGRITHPTRSLILRYILISPPIGVSWFLTPFRGNASLQALQRIISAPREEGSPPSVLVVHGDQDNFTSLATYEKWLAKLEGESVDGALRVVCVPESNHFWPNPGRKQMLAEVERFISGS